MKIGAMLLAFVRAIGILGVIWVSLFAIAFFGDVMPTAGEQSGADADSDSDSDEEPVAQDEPQEGQPIAERTPSVPSTPPTSDDEGDESESSDATTIAPTANPLATSGRLRVCESGVHHVAISSGDLFGDARPELFIACEGEVQILGTVEGKLIRLARVSYAHDGAIRPAAPLVVDLNGDERPDLVVGFANMNAEGGPDGGALALVPADARGGLAEAEILAPISAIELASARLNADETPDLAALHWADGFGRRPSEVWVFAGGASPARSARRRLGGEGKALAPLRLAAGAPTHLIVAETDSVMRLSGNGQGAFPTVEHTALPVAQHLVTGDVDGDGNTDLLIQGQGIHLWRGDQPEATPLDAPTDLLGAAIDPSGRLLLWSAERLEVHRYASERLERVSASPMPTRLRTLALASHGDSAALLLRSSEGVELALLPLRTQGEIDETSEAADIVDAPLVLNVAVQ